MLLSTSNSEKTRIERAIAITLLLLAVLYLCVEILAAFGFSSVSRIQRRVEAEDKDVKSITPSENGKPSVLVAGNSLLLEGVDFPRLQQTMSAKASLHRFTIEQTQYLDWYFGLKRLYRAGMRPAKVVLVLNARQLIDDSVRGDYFAYYLLDPRDIFELHRRAHLDLTTTTGLLIASRSPWFGARSEIRNWLLGKMLPTFGNLVGHLREEKHAPLSEAVIQEVAAQRLPEIQALCRAHGSQFVLLMPPLPGAKEAVFVKEAAQARGVRYASPLPELPAADFRDGFHLNETGRKLFTDKLIAELPQVLAN